MTPTIPTAPPDITSKTTKNRSCPCCHRLFTSSALGRHLDLYIRERNPRPPDDLHSVEAIKQLRRHITRRNTRRARPNDASREEDNVGLRQVPDIDINTSTLLTSKSPIAVSNLRRHGSFAGHPSWEATGVISDLPAATTTAQEKGLPRRPSNTAPPNRSAQDQAAQYALKEVLEGIKAATLRAQPPRPFDFNFLKLSLPDLYLRCLEPPPQLLHRVPRRALSLSWPIEPPDALHCEVLRDWLNTRLANWRNLLEAVPTVYDLSITSTVHAARFSRPVHSRHEESLYYQHLEHELAIWSQQTESERALTWQKACAKAYANECDMHDETKQKLESAEQLIDQLQGRIAQLVDGDEQTRQIAALPSISPSLPLSTATQLVSTGQWDYASLISKWSERLGLVRKPESPV